MPLWRMTGASSEACWQGPSSQSAKPKRCPATGIGGSGNPTIFGALHSVRVCAIFPRADPGPKTPEAGLAIMAGGAIALFG